MRKTITQQACFVLFAFVTIGYLSCEKIVEPGPDLSLSYYPLKIGAYKTYHIDSVVYDEYNCQVDTVSYQLKEIYSDTITDGENELSYRKA